MKPLLSIVIPTYNLPNAIYENVMHLLKIPEKNLEIVVVDNDAETDNTKNKLEAISDIRFRYLRNDVNIGRTRNIVRAVECAKSDFVFLCSTLDQINLKSIGFLLEKLNDKVGLILGNIVDENGDYQFKVKDAKYEEGYEALINVPFIGSIVPMILNKVYLDFTDLTSCNDESYMQMRMVFQVCGKGKVITVNEIIGCAYEIGTYTSDIKKTFNLKLWDVFSEKGDLYYHPYSRALQMIQYTKFIERGCKSKKEVRLVLLRWIEFFMKYSLQYAICNMDTFAIYTHGKYERLLAKKIMETFYETIRAFYESKQDDYYILGMIDDLKKDYDKIIDHTLKAFQIILKQDKEILFFGASSFGKKAKNKFEQMGIKGNLFADNDVLKQGSIFEGLKVISPDEIDFDKTIVIITSTYCRDIYEQLKKYGKMENVYEMDSTFFPFLDVWCADIAEERERGYEGIAY